jgi:hypothetical protein
MGRCWSPKVLNRLIEQFEHPGCRHDGSRRWTTRPPIFFKDRIMTVEIPETVLSERKASQGVKLGHVRYVLITSLVLCAAAGTMFYFFH